jgi:enoyl-CoA hydratase/carnithine racemase
MNLEHYMHKYRCVDFSRTNEGVLEMRLHTDGGSLRWGTSEHQELYQAFWDVGNDRDNRVVIMTGTGDEFSGPIGAVGEHRPTNRQWDEILFHGRQLQINLLDIDVPMIAAINGPAYRHSELPLLCDIVLATDTTIFADTGHFETGGLIPGDGINTVMTLLIGPNRARYYHLMNQAISAKEALELGMVNEVLSTDELMPRAREIASHLACKPLLHLRYSRAVLVEPIKEQINRWVGYGLALEGLAATDPEG